VHVKVKHSINSSATGEKRLKKPENASDSNSKTNKKKKRERAQNKYKYGEKKKSSN